MKKCPVCGGISFDDALTCFGCMHRFDEVQEAPVEVPAEPPSRFELPLAEAVCVQNGTPQDDGVVDGLQVQAPAYAPRMSGRATLRRRGTPNTSKENAVAQIGTQHIVLPENAARYELVVSLQPVG